MTDVLVALVALGVANLLNAINLIRLYKRIEVIEKQLNPPPPANSWGDVFCP